MFALQGCASDFTEIVKSRAPEQGVTEIAATYRAGITSIRSQAFIPGKSAKPNMRQIFRCQRSGISVELQVFGFAERAEPKKLCEKSLEASEFTRRHMPLVRLDYRVILVQSGTRLDRKWLNLSPPRRKILTLAIPIFPDDTKTVSVLTDTIAHETFHLAGFLNRLASAGDEEVAYYFGICANFESNKSLNLWDLPGAALGSQEAGEVAGESSQASQGRPRLPNRRRHSRHDG